MEVTEYKGGTNFNPRSPRGERRGIVTRGSAIVGISIHAPREGSDVLNICVSVAAPISIHAPREGSDRSQRKPCLDSPDFNPRSPRGERHVRIAGVQL